MVGDNEVPRSAVFGGWEAYASTVVDICFGSGEVTLTLGQNEVALPEFGHDVIHVVTAYNPGREVTPEANAVAQDQLMSAVSERPLRWWPALGRDVTSTWVEPSVAICGMTESEALVLGREFGQDAVFRVIDGHMTVLSCAASTETEEHTG